LDLGEREERTIERRAWEAFSKASFLKALVLEGYQVPAVLQPLPGSSFPTLSENFSVFIFP
jgi:hypothetical protein